MTAAAELGEPRRWKVVHVEQIAIRLVLVRCACGLRFSVDGFQGLELVGWSLDATDPHIAIEKRECYCGAELALEYVVSHAELAAELVRRAPELIRRGL